LAFLAVLLDSRHVGVFAIPRAYKTIKQTVRAAGRPKSLDTCLARRNCSVFSDRCEFTFWQCYRYRRRYHQNRSVHQHSFSRRSRAHLSNASRVCVKVPIGVRTFRKGGREFQRERKRKRERGSRKIPDTFQTRIYRMSLTFES
jgi:hypothetical protein